MLQGLGSFLLGDDEGGTIGWGSSDAKADASVVSSTTACFTYPCRCSCRVHYLQSYDAK